MPQREDAPTRRRRLPWAVDLGLAAALAVPVVLYMPRSFDTLSTGASWAIMLASGAVFGFATIALARCTLPVRAPLVVLLVGAAVVGAASGRHTVGRASVFVVALATVTVVSVWSALILRPVRTSLENPDDLRISEPREPMPHIHTVRESSRGLVAAIDVEWPRVEEGIWEFPLRLPRRCSRCLAPAERAAMAARSIRTGGVTRQVMVRVPYCNRCHATDAARDRRATRFRFLYAAFLAYMGIDLYREGVGTIGEILVLAGFVLGLIAWRRAISPALRANAVDIVLLHPNRAEFRFASRDYGRLVVEANRDGPDESM